MNDFVHYWISPNPPKFRGPVLAAVAKRHNENPVPHSHTKSVTPQSCHVHWMTGIRSRTHLESEFYSRIIKYKRDLTSFSNRHSLEKSILSLLFYRKLTWPNQVLNSKNFVATEMLNVNASPLLKRPSQNEVHHSNFRPGIKQPINDRGRQRNDVKLLYHPQKRALDTSSAGTWEINCGDPTYVSATTNRICHGSHQCTARLCFRDSRAVGWKDQGKEELLKGNIQLDKTLRLYRRIASYLYNEILDVVLPFQGRSLRSCETNF